jgi:hypothetical protein
MDSCLLRFRHSVARFFLGSTIFVAGFTLVRAVPENITGGGAANGVWRKASGSSLGHRFDGAGDFEVLTHAVTGGDRNSAFVGENFGPENRTVKLGRRRSQGSRGLLRKIPGAAADARHLGGRWRRHPRGK